MSIPLPEFLAVGSSGASPIGQQRVGLLSQNEIRQDRRVRRAAAGRLTPGPKPKLSRTKIIDQALVLLAESGPDGLSLRRLAAVCGVTPMTLYGYFASKDDLLDAVVSHVMPAPSPEPTDSRIWSEKLHDCIVDIQDAFMTRPGVAAVLAGRSMPNPGMDQLREYILELLGEAGIASGDRVAVLGVISRYILGCAVIEGATEQRGTSAENDRLRALPASRFPELSALAEIYGERASHGASQLGVDLLIMGIAGFAVQRRKP